MTNLDSILKSRDITLPTKVHLVKAIVFPVIMYGCVSWTIKKAEHTLSCAADGTWDSLSVAGTLAFANKGPSSQSYVFSEVVYRCESWTIKNAEHQRIDAFVLWFWRRFLRVPGRARRSKQFILREI